MHRRPCVAVLVATGLSALPVTVLAQRSPSLATPTTTTTTPALVIVTPTTATAPPVIVAPTTATAPPVIVTPTTTTAPPVIVTPTTTTAPPVIVNPTTTTGLDDLVQATLAPDDGSDVPLGGIDTSGAVPEGLDLAAFPGAPEAPTPAADGPTFAAGFSCAYQCIKSGVAYPRGFGALLVVETHVPARLFMSVVDDNNDLVDATNSTGMVSDFSWALDHLDPGRTYYAMVAATDENDDTAYAYGEFETLSQRAVTISIGSPTVTGGPTNIVHTSVYLKVADLNFRSVVPPESLVYFSLPRHLDLALFMFREWATSQYTLCEGIFDPGDYPQSGDSDAKCGTWNTATLADLDLDAIPAGRSRWTEVSITSALQTPTGDGAFPPGHGDPRYFDFSAAVTLTVEYS